MFLKVENHFCISRDDVRVPVGIKIAVSHASTPTTIQKWHYSR